MATEDDNFDIDIYGDAGGYEGAEAGGDYKSDEPDIILDVPETTSDNAVTDNASGGNNSTTAENAPHKIFKTDESAQSNKATPDKPEPPVSQPLPQPPQGVKRKESPTERTADPNATTALYISDLHWWTTDDEVRGWVNQAGCEDELKDVTFSEHKVNGKSKGQAFVEFTSPQAATAAKHKIESLSTGQQNSRKYTVNFTPPHINPFRTLPKDNPMRGKEERSRPTPTGFNNQGQSGMNFGMGNTGGFRGGRGGGFNRGGMNMGGFNNNRNFSGPMGAGGGFQGGTMNPGFQSNPVGGMQFGNFGNRGGMMNMRGGPNMRGRGGMGGPMGGNMMPVGGMGMGMGMGNMGMGMPNQMGGMMGGMQGGMGMQGFQNQNPHFTPNFFNQHGGGDGSWNPHGAKRTRQE